MPSLTKLRRHLLRWQRYADRVAFTARIEQPWAWQPPPGFQRAAARVFMEVARREERATLSYWPSTGSPPALPPPVPICCMAGCDGHEGPCVLLCTECQGEGACPWCGGQDDLGCADCGGTGTCPECHGEGRQVLIDDAPPLVVTTHAFADRGLL